MTFLAWSLAFAIIAALAAAAAWIMTAMKGGRASMDSLDHETTSDRFWKAPF